MPISKLHVILAVTTLLVHNNKIICYNGQAKSLRLKSSSKWIKKRVPFILLLLVHTFLPLTRVVVECLEYLALGIENHAQFPAQFLVQVESRVVELVVGVVGDGGVGGHQLVHVRGIAHKPCKKIVLLFLINHYYY